VQIPALTKAGFVSFVVMKVPRVKRAHTPVVCSSAHLKEPLQDHNQNAYGAFRSNEPGTVEDVVL